MTEQNLNISGRQSRADVIRSPVLWLRGPARIVTTYLDSFNLFFDKLMFDRVVEKINLRINWYLRVCVGVCVCVCVFLCVSLCVFIFFHREGFFRLQDF